MDIFNTWISAINDVLWSYILIIMLLGCAIWFTFKTRFVQFRMIKEMIKLLGDSTGKTKTVKTYLFFSGICRIAGQPCRNRQSGGSSYGNCGWRSGAVFWMWIIA